MFTKAHTPRENPMSDVPIIKIFTPENAEASAAESLAAINAKLENADTKRKLIDALNEYGVKALVIAPDFSHSRSQDTGAELMGYFLAGQRPLSPLALVTTGGKVEEVLGQKMGKQRFDRDSEQTWQQSYKMTSAAHNPFTQVFAELDGRKPGTPTEVG